MSINPTVQITKSGTKSVRVILNDLYQVSGSNIQSDISSFFRSDIKEVHRHATLDIVTIQLPEIYQKSRYKLTTAAPGSIASDVLTVTQVAGVTVTTKEELFEEIEKLRE